MMTERSVDTPQRYSLDCGPDEDSGGSMVEDAAGEWVKWDDVKCIFEKPEKP